MKNKKKTYSDENSLPANKETKYCIYLKQAICKKDEYSYAIERIFVKNKAQEEIRFTFYKAAININGKEFDKLVPRPLDVSEEELLELFQTAFTENIFSKEFLKSLKSLLP